MQQHIEEKDAINICNRLNELGVRKITFDDGQLRMVLGAFRRFRGYISVDEEGTFNGINVQRIEGIRSIHRPASAEIGKRANRWGNLAKDEINQMPLVGQDASRSNKPFEN